jgi:hypothetical protein
MDMLAQLGFPTLAFLGALALTIFMLLLRVQRYYGRPQEPRPSLAPPPHEKPHERTRDLGDPSSMLNWEVEMHETARELSAELNSKMGVLEHLVREADRAAARLEAALAAARGASPQSTTAPDPLDATSPSLEAARVSTPVSQAEALRSGSTAAPIAVAAAQENEPAAPRPPAERRYEEIYTLADYGLAPTEIAHRVGSPVGEVELILRLRAKR